PRKPRGARWLRRPLFSHIEATVRSEIPGTRRSNLQPPSSGQSAEGEIPALVWVAKARLRGESRSATHPLLRRERLPDSLQSGLPGSIIAQRFFFLGERLACWRSRPRNRKILGFRIRFIGRHGCFAEGVKTCTPGACAPQTKSPKWATRSLRRCHRKVGSEYVDLRGTSAERVEDGEVSGFHSRHSFIRPREVDPDRQWRCKGATRTGDKRSKRSGDNQE